MAVIATPNNTQATAACPQLPDGAFAIVPSGTDTFAQPVSVYVGGAGIAVVTPANGNADVSITMPSGSMIPFRVTAVKATSTATLMVGVY